MADFDAHMARQLDERMRKQTISNTGRQRVLASLRRQTRADRSPRVGMWGLAVALGAVLAFAGTAAWRIATMEPNDAAPKVAAAVPETWVVDDDCAVVPTALGRTEFTAGCQIGVEPLEANSGLHLQVFSAAEITGRAHGVSVHTGSVTFEVDPIKKKGAPPIEVGVPFGLIEVLGTRFAVHALPSGGEVSLYEGTIRFSHASGSIHRLRPGQRLTWDSRGVVAQTEDPGVRQEATPVPLTPAETEGAPSRAEATSDEDVREDSRRASRPSPHRERRPRKTVAGTVSIDEALARVAMLRRQGRLEAALGVLRELESQSLAERTREVLSFERGTLMEHLERDDTCDHWTQHRAEFPEGVYADAVDKRIDRCAAAKGPR